jgi:hypothetical protein
MYFRVSLGVLAWMFGVHLLGAERINQEGRILGPQLSVTAPILFNTAAADSILSSLQIMPMTSAWNEDVSKRPLLVNSDAMINQIISDLATNRRTLRVFFEMNFVLVPDNQPLVPIDFFNYPDESDPSPYPIPANMPVETWPRETGALTLQEWQMDVNGAGGDRHSIVVQPGAGFTWETWLTQLTTAGDWTASNGAKFDLKSNTMRPSGWTSGDAAGLSMFPALVRFDECERGMVEHAMRIVVKRSRKEFIYPATHYASTTAATQTNVPAMGQRVRLKQSFQIPFEWTGHEKAVLQGLKKYGALVADNGNFFSISATPDDRWGANEFSHLSSINITNFEVVQSTGPNGGPRSPGAPVAHAGGDLFGIAGVPVQLNASVTYSAPVQVSWTFYSGPSGPSAPGTVLYDNSAPITNTTAIFSLPGNYTLLLTADDGIHAIAYDALHVTITDAITLRIANAGSNVNLTWTGPASTSVIERTTSLNNPQWTPVLTTSVSSASFPFANQTSFFRIRE